MLRASVREFWPLYLYGGLVLLIALTITRGLWWQWSAIFTASPAIPPTLPAAQPAQPARGAPQASGAAQPAPQPGAANPANPAQAAPGGARRPLPPTDEPAPRNTIDRYGVAYDAQGVAVMGIDADPGGVYNVPPGRQLRIGGPGGSLYDVGPNGQLTPAARVRD